MLRAVIDVVLAKRLHDLVACVKDLIFFASVRIVAEDRHRADPCRRREATRQTRVIGPQIS